MLIFQKTELLQLVQNLTDATLLQLVHDQGVYVMCTAQPLRQRVIVYAEGCKPDRDEDWWHTSARLAGGDDFGEDLCTAGQLRKILATARETLRVTLTPDQIHVAAD